jgi:CBS domain-containing protein
MRAQPSKPLIEHWTDSLAAHLPFARMDRSHVQSLVRVASERYFPPEATVLGPQDGVPQSLIFLRQGRLVGRRSGVADAGFEVEAGGLLPVAALMAQRAVSSTYTALEDCFCLCIPWPAARDLMRDSPVWADFLNQRMLAFVEASRQRWQQELQLQSQQQQNLEARLMDLPARQPVTQPATARLQQVLELMRARKIGSVLLTDESEQLCGILTRNDVLDRVTLAGLGLDQPVSKVMSAPVWTIEATQTVFEAALMMSRHGVRHLPVVSGGHLFSVISERDLFALQNHSIKHVSGAIAQSQSLEQLQQAARQIRQFTAHLMGQGMQSRPLTRLISQLNDNLTERLIELELKRHGLSAKQMCWVALGSEGRGEQTIATDQDNALIYESSDPDRDQPRWLAFALDVNRALDACGYPLCTGGVMASNPPCCLTLDQWRQRFAQWIEQGGPQDLLKASVFFDFRALAGRADWLAELAAAVRQQALQTPRFIQQWVQNNLRMSVALNWHGGLETQREGEHEVIDIKLHGTALVVDAARILAYAQAVDAVSTVDRLEQAGAKLGIPADEYRGWMTAFDYLQSLRLRHQVGLASRADKPNSVAVDLLDQVDRRVLKASLSAVRTLQQRLSLDYVR